jgi:hypothetical protein
MVPSDDSVLGDRVPVDPHGLRLNGGQHKALVEALVSAFPTYQDLKMFAEHGLGKNLETIAGSGTKLNYVTFELVNTQIAAGHLLRLVAAARAAQPDNVQLIFVAEAVALAMRTLPPIELQRIVKKTSVPFDVATWRKRLLRRENCVCRIELPTNAGMIFGTGFLVGPDLILTNHHVMAPAIARGSSTHAEGLTVDPAAVIVRFDYKALADGTQINPGIEVRLATGWLVDFTPHSKIDLQGLPKQGVPSADELDYALIRLADPIGTLPLSGGDDPMASNARGWIDLHQAPWPFGDHQSLFIIQHPRGAPMKLALDLQAVMTLNENGTRVRYQTGTEEGSSGSPCFNEFWDVVALHHAGDPAYAGFSNPTFNEGIPIDRIVARLQGRGLTAGLTVL